MKSAIILGFFGTILLAAVLLLPSLGESCPCDPCKCPSCTCEEK